VPATSEAVSIVPPPMWEIGQAIGYTSSGPKPVPPTIPDAEAMMEESVWRAPFGFPVVPEEK